ncbi:uncharacterized protein dind [Ochlerotatus camptorhynchus]|uniref:uncharacterized protein dind n=1 Tax=Ochlerotatus camptorhynchus TaxID=644619 RepID=UPI0031D045E5
MSFIAAEIKGFQEFQTDVLLQVLNSKRLLIDHVELLEECLEDTVGQTKRKSNFTAIRLLLSSIPVATTFLTGQSSHKWVYPLSGLTAAYGTSCCIKWANQHRFRQQRKLLTRFIQSLEQFEMAVKKNLLFLNESQHIRTMQIALDKSGLDVGFYAANCAKCCIDTIKVIHAAVQHLEQQFTLTPKWNGLYSPIEPLEDCDMFSEEAVANLGEPKAIKDNYNIFAYIQSQYLTRLALSVASGLSNFAFFNLPELCEKLDDQKALCMKHLNLIFDSNRERAPRVDIKVLPPELSNLRSLSMGLSAKLYSTVHRYNQLEESLEEIAANSKDVKLTSQLQALEPPVEDIINDLNASAEECQRLLITLKKILNKDDESIPLEIDPRFKENLEQALDSVPNVERIFSEQDKPCIRDEFFAVDGTEQDWLDDDEQRSLASVDNLENINSKIVKRHFKPVLKQLRERIEPIGVEFKEREKRALKDKGIDVEISEQEEEDDEDGSLDHVPVKRTLYSSDSEDDREEDERSAIKFQRSVQRYDDIRGFLATKEQMNIFGLKPMTSVVNEDVLE